MEEQKITTMSGAKEDNAPVEQPTYEELMEIANRQQKTIEALYGKLQEANLFNMYKRLDYLFKVLDVSREFEPEFVETCASEIKEMITLPAAEEDGKVSE